MALKITTRSENYADWYVELVTRAQLADYSPVKGCMVIRPRGYAMWELLQKDLDERFKLTGHQNAYFPLLIPQSFITKEKEHVEGFAPELAVVTHGGGEALEDPLVLRPTSETIIWSMYKKWIQSYRDLPLLINQWANVIRWEKRTRLFLRTTEFLWQEGHTAHETKQEAVEETLKILQIYKDFAEETLAIPVIHGKKSDSEKFAGAIDTYAIEALMQDGKSLQAGTSHFLGQNFAKAFDVTFQNRELGLEHVWATSWGVSTRLIGAIIMTHSDDKGLVAPPKIAPQQIVLVPILKGDNTQELMQLAQGVTQELSALGYRIVLDQDDSNSPGWKFAEWELRGVPLRIELGPKDLAQRQVVMARRDTGEKLTVPLDRLAETTTQLLKDIQDGLLENARKRREAHTHHIDSYDAFKAQLQKEVPGYIVCGWDGNSDTEAKIKEDTKATIRVILEEDTKEQLKCIYSGRPATHKVVFAKAY